MTLLASTGCSQVARRVTDRDPAPTQPRRNDVVFGLIPRIPTGRPDLARWDLRHPQDLGGALPSAQATSTNQPKGSLLANREASVGSWSRNERVDPPIEGLLIGDVDIDIVWTSWVVAPDESPCPTDEGSTPPP
jgi:hypothetical protein